MSDPITVGLDLRLAGYRHGGIARYARELASAIDGLEDVKVVGIRSRKQVDPSERDDITCWTPPHHRFEHLGLGVEVGLRARGIDLYHATDFVAPKWLSVPRVATVMDLAFIRWPGLLTEDSSRYYRQVLTARSWTDRWIAPSRWTQSQMTELLHISPDRISVVPLGVPKFLEGVETLPLEERRDFLLAVGTIEPRKRYDLLLDAVDAMPNPPWLVVAGAPGWNSDATAERLREHPAVDWRPTATDADLLRFYRKARALVIPSLDEGFGLTALEAIACGTPVVSSGFGALPEVTGSASIGPAKDDAESWADSLTRILEDDDLWDRLSASCRQQANKFDRTRVARETVDVYLEVLREHR